MPMIQLVLDLDSGESLDVESVFESLRIRFPSIQLDSGDALADRAFTARAIADELGLPQDKKEVIFQTLDRNATLYGPAYSLSLPSASGIIKGTLRPIDLAFWTEGLFSEEQWSHILNFVRALKCGRVSMYEDHDTV